MKAHYDTVIIGGGITGAAVAYSLTGLGKGSVALFERAVPAGAATAKAATLVSLARTAGPVIPHVRETIRQIGELSGGRPESVGYRRVGSIHAASTAAGAASLDKTRAVSAEYGIVGSEIPAAKAAEQVPWIRKEAIGKAYFYGEDGFVDGYLLTMAYLGAARRNGLALASGCGVDGIARRSGGYALQTAAGTVRARNVVLAAGAWSNLLLEGLGTSLPLAPVRSQYWLTGHNPALFPERHPICILPDARAYTRPENGSLVVGWREPECVWVSPRAIPGDAFRYRFAHDPDGWDNLEGCAASLLEWYPGLADQGIARYVAGFSTYTPDGLFNAGPVPDHPGLFAAAGCAGMGIAVSGGIGRALAECIIHGGTDLPMAEFSPGRFGPTDALSEAFMRLCADARAGKRTG